jgi:hypothetical protein
MKNSNRHRSASKTKSSASKTKRDKSDYDMFNSNIEMSNTKSIDYSSIVEYAKQKQLFRSSSDGNIHEKKVKSKSKQRE